MHELTVNPDGSELIEYTLRGMPLRACADRLRMLPQYRAACHWHDDFEILMATDGEMDYFVNGRTVHLAKGEAIFVNARRLHYGYSAAMRDCGYRFAVFSPAMLEASPALSEALTRLTAPDSPDFWHLEASMGSLVTFSDLYDSASRGDALRAFAKCAELALQIRDLGDGTVGSGAQGADWAILQRMTGYIQGHYTERITLAQLSAAGMVCRSRCCALFREHLDCTPMEYILQYRLDKARGMLREGASVTEAALSCGFHGASYFAEVFRGVYGISPREFKRERNP